MEGESIRLNRRELIYSAGAFALPQGAGTVSHGNPDESQHVSRQFPNPDLGNLYNLIDWIAQENGPSMSFLDNKWQSLDSWKRQARPVFHRLLQYQPKPVPLSGKVLHREQREGFTLETVKISATSGYDIPAWVLIPSGRKGPMPGVVAIHCHSGRYVWGHEKILSDPKEHPAVTEFRNRAYGRPYAELLARRGYVVLVTDGFYFGERRLRPEEMDPRTAPGQQESLRNLARIEPNTSEWFRAVDRVCNEYETLTAKTIFSAGATWPGMLVWDDMRSVDYLCSRPEVDSRRIGCLGLSIGGLRTAYLIAADPRIKVACVTGWMTEFRQQLRNHLRHHTWMIYVPGLYHFLDLPDAAAITAPGALLVQQCKRDGLYPLSAMEGAVEKLQRIYAKAAIPERFRGTFYDVPHSFRPEMQDEAFEWLAKWI